ncbi:pollen receptor-like kinase 1 [Senna tora]|uniref:Pollen receptor-like kinase 1 n=1 Tax=Senna tora TaxID=362788 RepID=A0A834TEA0_9FABA|nr:pollen receptor-like kinase 1 [Senna tora]
MALMRNGAQYFYPTSPPKFLTLTLTLVLLTCQSLVPPILASDSELLIKFKSSLTNADALSNWNPSTPPCNGNNANWVGLLCASDKIWGLKLEKMELKGVIDVESLTGLPDLRTISLMHNNFDSNWPEFNKLIALKALYLSNNNFTGSIPDEAFQNMEWLKKIHVSNNQFTGEIPMSLTTLPKLKELKFDGNKFEGAIPDFKQPTLTVFNVANNALVGEIPPALSKISSVSFSGNRALCGAPLEACKTPISDSDQAPNPKSGASVGSIVVVSIVVALAVIVIVGVIFILHRRKSPAGGACVENPSSSPNPHKKSNRDIVDDGGSTHSVSSHASSSSTRRAADSLKLSFVRDDRERFDLHELLKASAEVLGSGCFSSSYKAALTNGMMIVVKRFKQMNNVGRDEFHEHMRRIGRLSHPNLLPLVAYYYRKEEKLLVTDYVKHGSLAVRLHGYQGLGQPSLDWPTRLKIVKGIAKGLEYLYKEMPSLIAPHGHLKSSNVLLGESFVPLLNDYGLVPVINQELAQDTMVIYKSPEYVQHGRVTKRTDVWSLGILIVEILTGKFPASFLQQGKGSEMGLANWVHSVVPEEWGVEVFDKEMGGSLSSSQGEMVKLLNIALACCEGDVDKRLDLKEAIERIQGVKDTD